MIDGRVEQMTAGGRLIRREKEENLAPIPPERQPIVLDKGKIVEMGSPAALQDTASGFGALFAEQFLTVKIPA